MYLIIVNTKGYKSVVKEIILQAEPFKGEHDKFHYCYEVYVPSTGWIYRGSRSIEDWSIDEYLGSSSYHSYKGDINQSKKIEFRILSFHQTRKEALKIEGILVDKIFVKSPNVYNLSPANESNWTYNSVIVSDGINTFAIKKDDPRYISGELKAIPSKLKGTRKDESIKSNMRKSQQKRFETSSHIGKNNPMFGKKHSEDTKDKLAKSKIGKTHTEEFKKKHSKIFSGSGNAMYGKNHSIEAKNKLAEKSKEFAKSNISPRKKIKIGEEIKLAFEWASFYGIDKYSNFTNFLINSGIAYELNI